LWPFLLRAAGWAVAAGVLWQFTREPNAAFTVWLTKRLHDLVGFPAPYLFADDSHLFWHATMFPPVVALTLGSFWLSWPARIVRSIVGYVVQCGVTAVAITLNESPYLQAADMLTPMTSTLVNADYLVIGVAIWVLLAGPWYGAGRGEPGVGLARRVWRALYNSGVLRCLLLWFGITLIVPAAAMLGSPEGRSARWEMAAALREVPYFPYPSGAESGVDRATQDERDRLAKEALRAIQAAIETDLADGREVGALWYLAGHVFNSMRPEDAALMRELKLSALRSLKEAISQGRR
jgi:hypothetical protein